MDICHPDTAIWPNPRLIEPPQDASPEEVELFEARVAAALAFAWTTLSGLTAGVLSICTTVVRPCSTRCGHPALPTYLEAPVVGSAVGMPFYPVINGGRWLNVWASPPGDTTSSITFPQTIAAIESIVIDGEVLSPSAYRVDNGTLLVRQDGGQWPVCQDMSKPVGQEGTWTVEFWVGKKPDLIDNIAAGILAEEYFKAITGAKGCRLPKGVRSIARQGVSYDIEVDMFERGLTGIHEVDMATARHNPNRMRTQPRIVRPTTGRRQRQTTWG